MTTEANENSNKSSVTGDLTALKNAPGCGPGCDCGTPSGNGNTKLKTAVCLVVFMAVGIILLFKTTGVTQTASGIGKNEFPTALAKTVAKTPANSAGQAAELGSSVPSIGDLNTVAAELDTVFLVIPAKDNTPAMKETGAALAAVKQTLKAKGINTGTFVLQTNSSDYSDVAAQMAPPGILVLTKGRGLGNISGEITETNLMQAYVASTSGGGCGTGCGPKGCPPSAAPAAAPSKK